MIAGLSVREGTPADLDRLVEFQNRYSRPGRSQTVELARRFEDANPEPNRLLLLAENSAGAVVAAASASDGGLMGGGQNRWRANIRVAPDVRGRGLGSQMLVRLEAHARANGAPRLQGAVRDEEPAGLRFANKHGYREFHRRYDSYLDVDRFDASRFEDAKTIALRAGVRVDRYDTLEAEAPDRVAFQRSTYESLSTTQMDIPRPEPLPPPPPFEAVREVYFENDTFARDSSVVALRDGRVVGTSITIIDPEGVAYTVYTGVDRAERGKGIALAMKLAILDRLKARGIKLFGTTNDEANAPMRGINAKLGYVMAPPTIEVEKVFEP
ncbi:MAG TPA: GNAT family N-acetyltransferase [Candidatus Saccharimonadales bacterium]|nr:GNAT family N-acetyltransferase [Candidatus Saccharimonadales bacterium]